MSTIKKLIGLIFIVAIVGCQELINIRIYDYSDISFEFDTRYKICKVQLYSATIDNDAFIISYETPIWVSEARSDCSTQSKINIFSTSSPPMTHDVLINQLNRDNFFGLETRFYELLVDGEEGRNGGLRFSCELGSCSVL